MYTKFNASSEQTNKSNSNRAARKILRIGFGEALVLLYSTRHMYVSAAAVREYYKRLGLSLDLRRVHDYIKRLVEKNILEKVCWGVYKPTSFGKAFIQVNLAKIKSIVFSVLSRKEFECDGGGLCVGGFCGVCVGGSVSGFVLGLGRFRVHVFGVSCVEDFVRFLYVFRRVSGAVLRSFRVFVGVSRFREIVRGVVAEPVDVFVGGHGVTGFRSRCSGRPLVSLDLYESLGLKPREVGVDVLMVTNIGRVFAKVYID
jgi:hypothetical protein